MAAISDWIAVSGAQIKYMDSPVLRRISPLKQPVLPCLKSVLWYKITTQWLRLLGRKF